MAEEVVAVGYVRTPMGVFGGAFKDVSALDLLTTAVRAVLQRVPQLDPNQVDEVVAGNVENRSVALNLARFAALKAGLSDHIPGYTVNRLCGSGMQAIHSAAQSLLIGNTEVAVAAGAENMSQYRYALIRGQLGYRMVDGILSDTLSEILHHPETKQHGAYTAENISKKYGVSREEQDRFAFTSYQRAGAAQAEGRFAGEICPVNTPGPKRTVKVMERDEGVDIETSLEKLANLKPILPGGTATPGNSCGINDGASAMVLTTRRRAQALGLKPLASILSMAVTALDPDYFGMGPVSAIRTALKRACLTLDQIGLVEINEAFAAQALACQKELGIDGERLNVNGGAIALGHALGNSGVRLCTTLLSEMRRRQVKHGVASLCIGLGMGIATVWQLE